MDVFQSIPFGVFSLKTSVRSHTSLHEELGLQVEYTNAARLALERCPDVFPDDILRLKGVHGCLKVVRCHGLPTTLASSEPDVWKSEGYCYHVQKSGDQIVIVLAQYVSMEEAASGRALTMSSSDCRSPCQLREAMSNALIEAFAPSCPRSKAIIQRTLSELMPEPPPLLQHQARNCNRQPAQDVVDARTQNQTMEWLSTGQKKEASQVSETIQPSPSQEQRHDIEDAISLGIEQVEVGWRMVRDAMQHISAPSEYDNDLQATQGLLWNPAAVLQRHTSHQHRISAQHRERLEPLLAEMHALLQGTS